jgi:hypothetical protein
LFTSAIGEAGNAELLIGALPVGDDTGLADVQIEGGPLDGLAGGLCPGKVGTGFPKRTSANARIQSVSRFNLTGIHSSSVRVLLFYRGVASGWPGAMRLAPEPDPVVDGPFVASGAEAVWLSLELL